MFQLHLIRILNGSKILPIQVVESLRISRQFGNSVGYICYELIFKIDMSKPSSGRIKLPDDFEEMDFSVEEENWNEYDLDTEGRIMARIILKKIIRDPNNPKKYSFDMSPPIYAVYSPQTKRGESGNEPPQPEIPNLDNYDIKIHKSDERWNVYRILKTGQTLRIRLTVTRIRRVKDRFDKDGIPLFLMDSGPMVVMDPHKKNIGQ